MENTLITVDLSKIDTEIIYYQEQINFLKQLRKYFTDNIGKSPSLTNGTHQATNGVATGKTAFIIQQIQERKKTTGEIIDAHMKNTGITDREEARKGIDQTLNRLRKQGRIEKDKSKKWVLKKKEQPVAVP